MSDLYSPSRVSFDAPPVRKRAGGVSGRIITDAASTRPWVLLLGILGFLFTGLMVLISIFIMFIPLGDLAGDGGSAFGFGIGLAYLLLSLIYFFPSLYLVKYGRALKALMESENFEDLEDAFELQKRFWKLIGIIVLVMIVVYIGMIFALIGAGALAALGS